MSYLKFTKLRKGQLITIALLGLPLRILSALVPKDRELSIYGSFNGYRIGDNSLFEFLEQGNAKTFFITKNKTLLDKPEFGNLNFVYAFSLKGIWLQLRAGKVYFSHGIFDFISPLVVGGFVTSLQHGYPIKNLGGLSKSNRWMRIQWLRRIFLLIFPHAYPHYCHRVFSPAGKFLENTRRMYAFTTDDVVLKSYARLRHTKPYNPVGRKVLLALTFSKSVPLALRLERMGLIGPERAYSALAKENLELVVRPHPIEIDQARELSLWAELTFDYSEDYNESLGSYLAIISDASSIAFDAIEIGSPVFFLADELAMYSLNENGIENTIAEGLIQLSSPNIETAIKEISEITREPEEVSRRAQRAKRVFEL